MDVTINSNVSLHLKAQLCNAPIYTQKDYLIHMDPSISWHR